MIKNILYVEDGSVDLDELESTLTTETKIIVYRQGSTLPILVQLQVPINDTFSEAEFTGNRNTGDFNPGDFNACNCSNRFFCTEEPKARVFNQEIDMTVSEFKRSKYYFALYSSDFVLIEEIDGKLIEYTYKEACARWWEGMSGENREIIKSIPNFDAKIFEEITGIKEEK